MKSILLFYILIGICVLVPTNTLAQMQDTLDDRSMNPEAVRICMYEYPFVYCEKIFGTLKNTNWVLETFYTKPQWHYKVVAYFQTGKISASDYINYVDFMLSNYIIKYDWRWESYKLTKNLSSPFTSESELARNSFYMNNWDEIKQTDMFDRL